MFNPPIPSTLYPSRELEVDLEVNEVVERFLRGASTFLQVKNTIPEATIKVDRLATDDNLQSLINLSNKNCLLSFVYDSNNSANYSCENTGEYTYILNLSMVHEDNNHHNIVQCGILLRNLITKSILNTNSKDNYFSFNLPNGKNIKMFPFRNRTISKGLTFREVNTRLIVSYVLTVTFFLTQ